MSDGRIRTSTNYQYPTETASTKLIDRVASACKRLADSGWREMFALHNLNIDAIDLAMELARPLLIDRSQPGFNDLSAEAIRGIEPGVPSRSFLFHAFASPEVISFISGENEVALNDFPTLAEIEAVENYVYGASPPSVEDLRVQADGAHLAIVVFASEYRPAVDTVHRRYADMCYSRTGIARVGVRSVDYSGRARGFVTLQPNDNHSLAVLPVRYTAYVAALLPGNKKGHGPMHFVEAKSRPAAGGTHTGKNAGLRSTEAELANGEGSDVDRKFWVPLHKLFNGDECLLGYDIQVGLSTVHRNEKIRRAHMFFGSHGHDGGWHEPDISNHPFVITSGIAEFSTNVNHGTGLLEPVAHSRLVEPAKYNSQPLTYRVPASREGTPWELYQSSLNLIAPNDDARRAPEYLHARHVVNSDGSEKNLNAFPDVESEVRKGGYQARHYVDYTADGWIAVECSALALEIPRRLSAFSLVSCPDYFPNVRQSDLTAWTDQSAPPKLLETVWPANPGRPEPLSSQRIAANLELRDAGFDSEDDTMTAIVGSYRSGIGMQMKLKSIDYHRASMLPDGAAGVFAPGWDASYDRTSPNPSGSEKEKKGITFLANYGLGSPFPEDAMLCAALSSFWPAVAPDITRTFAPTGRYHSATPLTDETIGLGEAEPWDGIKGPVPGPTQDTINYKKLAYGDYVEATLASRFDISTIANVSPAEYIARTLTTAMVYQALGVNDRFEKSKWAVLSFRVADPIDPDLVAVSYALKRRLNFDHTYRFEMIRHDNLKQKHPDPTAFDRELVVVAERVVLFADPTVVLRCASSDKEASLYARNL